MNNSLDSITEYRHVKIDQQSQVQSGCFEIGNDLCLVYWEQHLNSLQFNNQLICNKKI